jgi:DNA-binding HxlR family transcriptional regulator
MRKPSIKASCALEKTLRTIVGKWKTVILWHLSSGTKRYGELKKLIPSVSEKMLISSLRELVHDRLIIRKAYPEVPPHVEYSLSKKGQSLSPILCALDTWGKKHL